jgi:hypothetical protein
MYECGMNSVHSEQDLMIVANEHSIESSCSMKGGKFVHKLRDCQFLENNLTFSVSGLCFLLY